MSRDTGTNEVLCEVRDRVATITLNRPDAKNALTMGMKEALYDLLRDIEGDSGVGCILLTGAGDTFSAGGDMKRMQALFSGRVQGVGFRFTVCRVALSFKVTGVVRNLMDGNVEVVAEGFEQELVGFLNAIRDSAVGRYIAREQLRWDPATGTYNRFGISY